MSEKMAKDLASIRQKCRLLMLISALERVGIAPVSMDKLHAFAYLADVLSPVWGFVPYDGTILKIKDGPHYADLQQELDALVIIGLVDVLNLSYRMIGKRGARIDGSYELRFASEQLPEILTKIGADERRDSLDPRDKKRNAYLIELAAALSMLPDDEIDIAAQFDATYSDKNLDFSNVIELDQRLRRGTANKSVDVTTHFTDFLPDDEILSPGEKVYLYASYLGRKINGG